MIPKPCLMTDKVRGKTKEWQTILRVIEKEIILFIKVTGFEPMALCTQNRCADQTALHLVSPPRSIWIYPIDEHSNQTRPFWHRDARTNPSNLQLCLSNLLVLCFLFHFHFQIRSRLRVLWTLCLEVDSNHSHKDFQSFALTSWATWTPFLKSVFFKEYALPYHLTSKSPLLKERVVRAWFASSSSFRVLKLPPNLPTQKPRDAQGLDNRRELASRKRIGRSNKNKAQRALPTLLVTKLCYSVLGSTKTFSHARNFARYRS